MVLWKEFHKMLVFRQVDRKILERASIHLLKINDHIYDYLISPKDAFRQFDNHHTGQLTFEQFRDLIEQLYRLAREEVPPFAIIKDLFEFNILSISSDSSISEETASLTSQSGWTHLPSTSTPTRKKSKGLLQQPSNARKIRKAPSPSPTSIKITIILRKNL
jgi:hypothetical protein